MSKLNVGRKKCPCIEVHKLDGVNDMNGKNKNNNKEMTEDKNSFTYYDPNNSTRYDYVFR